MSDNKLLMALSRLNQNDLSAVVTRDRREVLGITAGVLIAMRLPLPTSPVEEIVNFYVATHEGTVSRMLDGVNEELFVNTNKAIEVARNVYMLRYRSVYDDAFVMRLLPVFFNGSIGAMPQGVMGMLEKVSPEVMAKAAEYYF